jgi:TetR/AcrR family fatty acid metabolism transcriptional regulator
MTETSQDQGRHAESVDSPADDRSRGSRARRESILRAAATLFAERGFAKTPVEEIAVAAGVSKGLVYVHFESKNALLVAVIDRAVADWTRATLKGSAKASSAMGVIVEGLRASVAYASHDPILRGILGQDLGAVVIPVRARQRSKLIEGYLASTRKILKAAVERGEVRGDADLDHAAEVIWMIHDGLVRKSASLHGEASGREFAALVDAAVDLFLTGLRVER